MDRSSKLVNPFKKTSKGHLKRLSIPLLVLHGEKDQLCSKDRIVSLLASCSGEEINLKLFKEGHHDLHLSNDRGFFHGSVLNWIKQNTKNASSLGPVSQNPNKKSNSKRNIGIIKILLILFLYFKGLQMLIN